MEPFDELVEKRKRLISAHNENGFANGIRSLLTDLYPDTAHFLYELLQNAEDMWASRVCFILKSGKLTFLHNGTKRDFNLDDIDAITSIGKNVQKRNDPTSIGKFGVGFKAVFSYTASPVIHSGCYDFKIQDYFLPSTDGVQHKNTIINGEKWTCFILPFNNPKKPEHQAYSEVLEGLQLLDENSILFLKNIRSIEIVTPNEKTGYVKSSDLKDNYIEIRCKKLTQDEAKSSVWLRFLKNVHVPDEEGICKDLNIGIAYRLVAAKNKDIPYTIEPIKGKTFIYFPAEKEESNLKFHINAPFASTVARDSIRNCPENNRLINELADLTVETLASIKSRNMLTMHFLAVLPNANDELSDFYSIIAKKVYHAFSIESYVPTFTGKYQTSGHVIRAAPVSIRNVFDNNSLQRIVGNGKVWCASATLQNSREDQFLNSLPIEKFDFMRIANLFDDKCRSKTEAVIHAFSHDKLRNLYALINKCSQHLSNKLDTKNLREVFKTNLKRSSVIKTTKGFRRPTEAFLLPINQKLISQETPIIPFDLYNAKYLSQEQKSDIRLFFDLVGIQEYGIKNEIQRILNLYCSEQGRNSRKENGQHYSDLIAFSEFFSDQRDIDFNKYEILLAINPKDSKLRWSTPSKLIIGKPFSDSAGDEIAMITNQLLLWQGYCDRSNISEKDLPKVLNFIQKLGAHTGLRIQEVPVQDNPQYFNKLVSGGRNTGYGISKDYSIPHLKSLLAAQNIKVSLAIWDTLRNYTERLDVTIALHSVNASETCKQADSQLVYYLKKMPWIPTIDRRWRCPAEMEQDMLPVGFFYSENSKLFKAIGFGENQKNAANGRQAAEEAAKKANGIFISREDLPCDISEDEAKAEYLLFIKSRHQDAQKPEPLQRPDINSALKKQNRSYLNPAIDNEVYFNDDNGAVPNIQRRTIKIIDSFIESKNTPVFVKTRMQRIAQSNSEEREQLKADYNGKCQICNVRIISYSGQAIFQAINIIDTSDLPVCLANTYYICWNSICLCPNCAAKYKHCAKNMDHFEEQVISASIKEGDGMRIPISINLDGKECSIYYTPRHFLALQTAMKLLKE